MRFLKSDFVQWGTIITLAGLIWTASSHASKWDEAVALIPRVEVLEKQMEVLVYRLSSLPKIEKHLASIDKKTQ